MENSTQKSNTTPNYNPQTKVEKEKKLTTVDLVEEPEVISSPHNKQFHFLLPHALPIVTLSRSVIPQVSPKGEHSMELPQRESTPNTYL